MTAATPPPVELDCRGLRCPMPVIELARAVDQVPAGGLVAVLATDAAAMSDIPAWCRMRGHELVGTEPAADGATRYLVRRVS